MLVEILPPLSKASTIVTSSERMNSFHSNTLNVNSKLPNTPYSFTLPLMIGETRLKISTKIVRDIIRLKMNWSCINMAQPSHINVSFAVRNSIERRTVLTMSSERLSYNQFCNGMSKQTNEDNTEEDNSGLTSIKGTIERKRVPSKIMKSEGYHVWTAIAVF